MATGASNLARTLSLWIFLHSKLATSTATELLETGHKFISEQVSSFQIFFSPQKKFFLNWLCFLASLSHRKKKTSSDPTMSVQGNQFRQEKCSECFLIMIFFFLMEKFLFLQHNFALNQPNWSSVNYLVSVPRLLIELELTYIYYLVYRFSIVALVTKYLSIITIINSVVKMIYPKIWPI